MLKLVIERKKRYSNNIDKVNARRLTWSKSQAKSRAIKNKNKAKELAEFSDATYQNDIYINIKDLTFYHQGTLRFNKFVSIEYATTAVEYYKNKVKSCVTNLVYTFQKGKDNNIHIHFAYQFTNEFLSLYRNNGQITKYLHSVWNNDKMKNGAVWVNRFDDNQHKKNYLRYMFREVLPLSKWHYKQKEVDLYYVLSFANISTSNCVRELNNLLLEAKIKPTMCYLPTSRAFVSQRNKMPYIKEKITKHKHHLITLALVAVWLVLV